MSLSISPEILHDSGRIWTRSDALIVPIHENGFHRHQLYDHPFGPSDTGHSPVSRPVQEVLVRSTDRDAILNKQATT